ncbi:uncharacterized protein LOC113320626 [Papaver somniferum]|nr:uncharacterized protein LOC113320626 [Papaver somniferum]
MWIGRYSDELEASALQIEELLNWLSNSLSNEKRRVPRDVYYQAFAQITLSPAQEKSIFGLPPRAGNTHFLVSHADLRSACNDIAVFDKREGDKWSLAILAIQTAVGYEYDSLCKVLDQPFLVRENGTYTFVLKGLMKSAPPGDSIESNLSWLIICTLASVVLPSQVPMSLPGCFTFDSNAPPNDGGAGKRKSTREPDPYFLRCRHCGCRIVARNLAVEFGLLYGLLDVPQRRLRFALEIQHDRNVIRFDSLCVSCNTILGFAYLSVIHRWQFHFLFREMVY